MCCDPEDNEQDFQQSAMRQVLERHANTIRIQVTIPPPRPPLPSKIKARCDAAFKPPGPAPSTQATRPEAVEAGRFDDNFMDNGHASKDGDAKKATPPPYSEVAGVNNGGGVADSASCEDRLNGRVGGVASASAGEASGTAASATPTTGSGDSAIPEASSTSVSSYSDSGPLTNSSPVSDSRANVSTVAESASSSTTDTAKLEPRGMHVCICMYVHVFVCVCVHVFVCMYVCMCMCACVCMYVFVHYVCVCV